MLYIVAIVFLIAVILVAAVHGRIISRRQHEGLGEGAYFLRPSLFTPAERSFLGILDSLRLDGYRVMAKVRLADVFGVGRGTRGKGWWPAFNRISAKHVDFLLIRVSDGAPVLGIELDDASHKEESRQGRDAFVDELYRSASLPLLHIPAQHTYVPTTIRVEIMAKIQKSTVRIDMKLSNSVK